MQLKTRGCVKDFDTPSFNLYQNFKTTLFDHNLLGLTIACFHDIQALL
mgnify:CR=1 FL=1